MDESFASLGVMELPGGPVGTDAGQRRHVDHPPKSAIVAFRPVQIPDDAAGINWYRQQSGVGLSWPGLPKDSSAPPGSHQEFRAEVALSRVEEVITGTRAAEAHDEYLVVAGQQ